MPVLNNGSIALNIFNLISPLPNSVSGLLITLVDNRRYFVENYTGDTIGNTIAERYQPAITDMALADTLRSMAVQDMGVKNVSVGDLSVDNSNLMEMAKQFEERGLIQLKSLSKGVKIYKARG